ncbi:MAG: twin-arginine translocase TatA/TatE family subunit [Planctomycetota bacterium]
MMHLPLALPGGTELWLIVLAVLLLFGGRKLPELARAMGTSITQFKRGLKDDESGDQKTIDSNRPPGGE